MNGTQQHWFKSTTLTVTKTKKINSIVIKQTNVWSLKTRGRGQQVHMQIDQAHALDAQADLQSSRKT
jgi:O-succinylbenzoate synthase